MGIKKQILSFFSFLKEDFKGDIKAIKHIVECSKNGKPIFNEKTMHEIKEYKKSFTVGRFLKDNWLGILFFILVFVVGWWLSAYNYQHQCNIMLQEAYEKMNPVSKNISDFFYHLNSTR